MKCDIEIYHHNEWHLAATFSVPENQISRGYSGSGTLIYNVNYAGENLEKNDFTALSCRNPVNFDILDKRIRTIVQSLKSLGSISHE